MASPGLPCFSASRGVAHRALGAAERARYVAHHFAVAAHEVAEVAAQSLLVGGAGIAVGHGLLAFAHLLGVAERLVQQLLLPLGELVHVVEHLHGLGRRRIGLLPVRHGLQVLEHLLQLRQHIAGGVAGAALGQLAGALQHLLQVLAVHLHHVRIERALVRPCALLLHVALHLLGQRGHELVHGLLHLVHQALDLFVRGALGERVLQRLLEPTQLALGHRQIAFLDAQGEFPEQRLHAVDGGAGGVQSQPALRHLQTEDHDQVVVVGRRLRADGVEGAGHGAAVIGIGDQPLALLDHGAGDRVMEDALGQHESRRRRWWRSGRGRPWRSAESAPAGRPRDAASGRDS